MAMFARADRPRDAGAATRRACGCASSAAATGVADELRAAHGLGRGADRRATSASRCSWRSTTAAGRRSSTRRERFTGETRGGVPPPPLRARHARSRPADPHQRRAAPLELPALAVAYSELVFRDELWPDFDREAFEAALEEFAARAAPLRGAVRRWPHAPPAAQRRRRRRALAAARCADRAIPAIVVRAAHRRPGRRGLRARACSRSAWSRWRELYTLMRARAARRPRRLPGARGAARSPPTTASHVQMVLVLAASFPVTFLLRAAAAAARERVWAIAVR